MNKLRIDEDFFRHRRHRRSGKFLPLEVMQSFLVLTSFSHGFFDLSYALLPLFYDYSNNLHLWLPTVSSNIGQNSTDSSHQSLVDYYGER